MLIDVVALLVAGCVLASLELTSVLLRGRALFVSGAELFSYALAAFTALPALVLLLGMLTRHATRADRGGLRARWGAALVSLAATGLAAWSLTEGRRVRDLAWRPVIVAAVALVLTVLVVLALRTATFARAKASTSWRVGISVASAGAASLLLLADAYVLPRSYPAFHWSTFAGALVCAALAGSVWDVPPTSRWAARSRLLALVCLLGAPFALGSLARKPNASYAVGEVAPWSAKLLSQALSRKAAAPRAASKAPAPVTTASGLHGIDLRDKDVLLITVDALRADALAAYGGNGLTPELDRLAAESVVFRRAYTPAPHTSYALASLLTAKFMKPVTELPGAASDHPTLPDLLRRYGYRTAAFYPPAIFFVDGARFEALRSRGFGFEYRKEMFAPASQRVQQLRDYLGEADPGHPLFVWVHLFEPHEPYDPPPELVRDDSNRGRYDGEVQVADRAIGELVRTFRAAKPGATVIVTADHGEEFGEHGGSYHGTTLFDEQVRIPLVWSSPGSAPAAIVDVPVELTDVGTTLLSVAGIPREARMRGDDLGPVLAGHPEAGPRLAFASVEARHMATDGRLKAMCAADEQHCQLFDLAQDPLERRNLAAERAADVEHLRGELDRFFATIPRAEALAVAAGIRFPEALARAKLGSPGAGPDVVPLLADARAPVRAAAARALGELKVSSALPMLDRLRESDTDESVRAEAAIAALALGGDAAADDVVALLEGSTPEALARARRAALALGRLKRREAEPVLAALALDEGAQEVDRLRAAEALGRLGTPSAAEPLIALLQDVRLRLAAADALGELGGARAKSALVKQFEGERYPTARRAEARALVRLRDPRAPRLIMHALGMESSILDGVRLLVDARALTPATARGGLASEAHLRSGSWECASDACAPGDDAELVLPARGRVAGPVRVTFLVAAPAAGSSLSVDGQRFPLAVGEQQLSFTRPSAAQASRFRLAVEGEAVVIAVVVVPARAELPPPPPEPWQADGGTDPG